MSLIDRMRSIAAAAPAPAASAAAPRVPLAARLGVTSVAIPPEQVISDSPRLGRPAVGQSSDLDRVCALPRRVLDPKSPAAAEKWTTILKRPRPVPCDCRERWGFCIRALKPIQGWGLEDAAAVSGELGLIGVGHGKTGLGILLPMVVPNCKVAVLFIPPDLRGQFARDFAQWAVHFRVPNLAGGRYFTPGLPVLHVVAYSELSSAAATDLLRKISPDLVIADEAHNLKRRESARTKRFLRYFSERPETRLVAMSGTLTKKSLKDYAHLSERALREGSPLPLHWPAVEEWATAIDPEAPGTFAAPIGALRRLCAVGESAREGFRRRLVETPGVVATEASALDTSLVIHERKVALPADVTNALAGVRATWQRPDGEELTDGLAKANVCRQLASGFYYRWIWPRGEPEPVIRAWLEARADWHREVREKLHTAREYMDSPLLLARAAIRWHDGFREVLEDGRTVDHPPHTRHRLTWQSEAWPRWRELKDTAEPQTEAVWISDFLAQDAAAWARDSRGVVWYEHAAFGQRVATLAGLPLFGPGREASDAIILETGKCSVIASVRAHGTGKNLQQWADMLVANPMADGGAWEQMLGRLHRIGQQADEVTATIYRHTPETAEAFDKAVGYARYIQETTGQPQKLLFASRTF